MMRKGNCRLRLTTTFLAAGLLVNATAFARALEDTGYRFDFVNNNYGNQHLYVCNTGARLDLLNYGVTLVAASPDWTLHAYCKNRKTFCTCGRESQPGRFQLHQFRGKVASEEKVVVKGLPAVRVSVDGISVPEAE